MPECLAVGAGGFAGAVLRYLAGLVPVKETTVFPVKTFIINVTGCIVIGFIAALVSRNSNINPRLVLFLKTGLCGGFTTFSTFALETSGLIKDGHTGIAFLYVILSILAGTSVIMAEQYFIK